MKAELVWHFLTTCGPTRSLLFCLFLNVFLLFRSPLSSGWSCERPLVKKEKKRSKGCGAAGGQAHLTGNQSPAIFHFLADNAKRRRRGGFDRPPLKSLLCKCLVNNPSGRWATDDECLTSLPCSFSSLDPCLSRRWAPARRLRLAAVLFHFKRVSPSVCKGRFCAHSPPPLPATPHIYQPLGSRCH